MLTPLLGDHYMKSLRHLKGMDPADHKISTIRIRILENIKSPIRSNRKTLSFSSQLML